MGLQLSRAGHLSLLWDKDGRGNDTETETLENVLRVKLVAICLMETNFLSLFNVFVSEIGKCNDLIISLLCWHGFK